MRKVKLDRIDRQILRDLQDQGRISNVDLAGRVGISAPPCLRRMRALEEVGYIVGYHAYLNSAMLDYHVTVFAQVSLSKHGDGDLKSFTELVNSWEMVRECHLMTGDYDVMLKIVAKDWDHYQNFLTETLTTAPNIEHVRSHLSVKATKDQPGVPVQVHID